jgi:hypothetical protein
MNLNKKILVISMLVMLVCCVSAVSATDINGTDDISDDIIIDENPVDEITDVVEDAEIDEVEDDPVEEQQQNLVEDGTVNGYTYDYYFNTITGELVPSENLNFTGNFYAKDFGNFKIGKSITINATGAIFHNIGFDLTGPQITLNGGTFIFDEPTNITAGLNVTGNGATIQNTVINVTAPENLTFYAIDVESASNVKLLDNIIYYICNYTNAENFNYVIKGKNSADLNITGNTINAYLPLKLVNWAKSGSIDADYVAGIALEQCGGADLIRNTVNVKGILRGGSFPTLDAIIIANSNDVIIEHNIITESDLVTVSGQANYIYGIDVYSCNNIKIGYNDITMNGNKSGGHIEGNGTGAAYCIQLSGEYQGADIYYNNLTTSNEGPNLAIYAQNYAELNSHIFIHKNNIDVTGKAGDDPWSLVSGIESQMMYSYIYDNIIHVNNTAGYVQDNYAFGISYAQWINGTHYYYIHNNTVDVINADYAVYLMDNANVTGSVTSNNLIAYTNVGSNEGDQAVSANEDNVYIDN